MKLKTFFISYLLFLSILLAAISTISIYLTNHQMTSLYEQSRIEFERISATISREIDAVYERTSDSDVIDLLLQSHIAFHGRQGIELLIDDTGEMITFVQYEFNEETAVHSIRFRGTLFTEMGLLEIQTNFDITEGIEELRTIQQIMLYLFVIFSLLAAVILYIILARIFKPLELVTQSTSKIASGDYSERLQIKGKNELALLAINFNQMAEEIEQYTSHLKDEADRMQQFIDNLAHELRTPLTSVYGYAEYMQKANLTNEDRLEAVAVIMEEAGYMRQIINSMLELATLRNYKPVMNGIDIEDIFKQIDTALELTFREYQIELVVNPCEGHILGQADLIKSLISNLCINAAKACMPNEGRVVLTGERISEACIQITVTDNGCGIAAENIAKLTEPFYQVDATRNKMTGGLGLGLAIVKQIVDSHQAKLEIESEFGVGTKIKITFNNTITSS